MEQSYIDFLRNEIKLDIVGKQGTSRDHCLFKCLLCGDKFKATPKSKVQNFKKSGLPGCPSCTHKARYESIDIKNKQRLLDMGYILHEPYKGLKEKLLVQNSNCDCGRSWETTPEHILSGRAFCKPCNDENKIKRLQKSNEIRHKNSLKDLPAWEKYLKEVRVLTEQTYKEHHEKINPNNYPRGRSGKTGAYHLDHIFSIKYCFYHDVPTSICAHHTNLKILPWKDNSSKWKSPSVIIPDVIKPYVTSSELYDNFYNHIKQYFSQIKFKHNHRISNGSPYTIPMFSEEYNFGLLFIAFDDYIESKLSSKSYISKIKKSASDYGINLLIVFEDEWINKYEIIIRKVEHICKLSKSKKIYARQCKISEIDGPNVSKFLNKTHVQGADISKIKLGAFYDNELVAVMTFCKPRKLMNIKDAEGLFELSRFSTNTDYRITGIASKLLSHFKNNYDWSEIYTYADLRWSNGNLYNQIGMEYQHTSPPNYYYIVDGKRKHRWQFRKSELPKLLGEQFDPSKTEYQNMLNAGYDRIWDCGNLKYKLTK